MMRQRAKKISEDGRTCETRSLISMNRSTNTNWIPMDLTGQILARLPSESLFRFRCVSKLWASIMRSREFVDSFMTRSLTQPRLLFVVEHGGDGLFFSTPQLRNAGEESSSSVATFHVSWSEVTCRPLTSQSVNGLICCGHAPWLVVCDPTTRQLTRLPKVKSRRTHINSYFGYDPIDRHYKVLCMTVSRCHGNGRPVISEEHQILTLGGSNLSWRMIECRVPHCPTTKGLSINGILYYGARANRDERRALSLIVSFDVRSESFDLVKAPELVQHVRDLYPYLMNYKGKLACLCGRNGLLQSTSLELWVLEDAVKYEWSKTVYVTPPSLRDLIKRRPSFAGGTGAGEIVFAPMFVSKPFYVFYYNLERDTVRRVEIKGVSDFEFRRDGGCLDPYVPVMIYPDHVENMMFF